MSVPRPKPWETSLGATGAAAASTVPDSILATSIPTLDPSSAISSTLLPERPAGFNSMTGGVADLLTMSSTSPYGTSGLGGSGYGSRYGTGYGSSMYGGGYGLSMYGGGYGSSMYGGGYGGYGSSMYGMGGYGSSMYGGGVYGSGGMGMGGMAGGPGPLGEGTQATFQLIESIIGAVGGFAQMLEATYMATHSSFFTMVSLAEQFGNLKNALGSLLGIFALIKFAKKILYKVSGKVYDHGISAKEFAKFEKVQKKLEDKAKRQQAGTSSKSRISFKPLLLFLAALIGFPYLLSKAIQKINEQQRQRQQQQQLGGGGIPGAGGALDPTNLQFAKAMYEFNPENPNIEIELKPNELVAILSKLDPMGNESKWWKVRSRLGKVGYVPLNYLAIVERRPPAKALEAVEVALTPKPMFETNEKLK